MTLYSVISEGLASRRLPMMPITAFGVLAFLLASVGVYAIFASMVAAREEEFAVRMALGSPRRAIVRLVLQQGAGWLAVGLAGGVLGILQVARRRSGRLAQVANHYSGRITAIDVNKPRSSSSRFLSLALILLSRLHAGGGTAQV